VATKKTKQTRKSKPIQNGIVLKSGQVLSISGDREPIIKSIKDLSPEVLAAMNKMIGLDDLEYPFQPAGGNNGLARLSTKDMDQYRALFNGIMPTRMQLYNALVKKGFDPRWMSRLDMLEALENPAPKPTTPSDLMTLKDAAKICFATVATLKRQIKNKNGEGLLTDYRKPGKRKHIVSRAEVAANNEMKDPK
jgi:hypothetical protein